MIETATLDSPVQPATANWIYRTLTAPGGHWVCLSITLYVAACFLPAMPPIFGNHKISGWSCLASLMYTIPAWWANPAYFVALFLYWWHRRRAAMFFSVIGVLLACSFEFLDFPNGGWHDAIFHQEIGCYFWIASMQVLACNLLWREWIWWRQRQAEMAAGSMDP